MTDVLLDACAFAWSLRGTSQITMTAQRAVVKASRVYLIPAVKTFDRRQARRRAAARAAWPDENASAFLSVGMSPIPVFEITQKVRLGKWPAMAPLAPQLAAISRLQIVVMASPDEAVCAAVGSMAWSHRDPFDRMMTATATQLGCPPASSDPASDGAAPRSW